MAELVSSTRLSEIRAIELKDHKYLRPAAMQSERVLWRVDVELRQLLLEWRQEGQTPSEGLEQLLVDVEGAHHELEAALLAGSVVVPHAGTSALPTTSAADEWGRRHAEYQRLFAAWDILPDAHPAFEGALDAYWDAREALVRETPAGTEAQFSQKLALVKEHFADDLLVESGTLDRLIAEARRMERMAI